MLCGCLVGVMSEGFRREIVQQVVRNLLDLQLLRIVGFGPSWGYAIKKRFEADFGVRLRHAALYSSLDVLRERGFLECSSVRECGRNRKVYAITEAGRVYLETYYRVLGAQIAGAEAEKTG